MPASTAAARRLQIAPTLIGCVALALPLAVGSGVGPVEASSAPPSTPVDQDVQPFAAVQDGDVSIAGDPADPTRAILHVTTTEPMICAVAWGETEAFGRLNNSLAMTGTGLTDHDVVLPDVGPGITYHYRIQGTTADGTLYRSPTATFTIDAAADVGAPPTTVEHGPNLALGATVVDVSSEFSAAFAATNALDGDGLTEWSSAGDGDDAFVTIDLGSDQAIAGVEFVTRSMADGTAITETFTVTIDGGAPVGPFPASTPADRAIAPVDATGREVRFDVATSTGGNVGAVELAVYAP